MSTTRPWPIKFIGGYAATLTVAAFVARQAGFGSWSLLAPLAFTVLIVVAAFRFRRRAAGRLWFAGALATIIVGLVVGTRGQWYGVPASIFFITGWRSATVCYLGVWHPSSNSRSARPQPSKLSSASAYFAECRSFNVLPASNLRCLSLRREIGSG